MKNKNTYQVRVDILKLHYPIDGKIKYDAQIVRSVDGGKTFYHCGEGRYFENYYDAKKYKLKIEKERKK